MEYKIAIGGLHIESSTFTTYRSNKSDFLIRREEEMLIMYPWISKYDENIKFIPTIHARALPGGIVKREFFDEFFEEMKDKLQALKKLKIDGFIFDIHGAMSIEGMDDAEGFMLEEIRKIIGYDVVVSTTMDLHGNVSDSLFQETDLITCYRTAPHIDSLQTRERAFDNLIYTLKRGKTGFIKAKVDVPLLLSGEKTSTEVEPGKTLYKKIDAIMENENILDVAIWMGFPWADQPRSHAYVVVTGFNIDEVRHEATKLGEYFWSIRNDFKFVGPVATVKEAVRQSLEFNDKPFFISDTGDNPGAGGSGDLTILLNEFLSNNSKTKITKKVLIASLVDKEAIGEIYKKRITDYLEIAIGGKIDPDYGKPARCNYKIKHLFNHPTAGRSAVLSMDNLDIIVTEKRFQYGSLKAFNDAGIEKFSDYDIIVVKIGYLEPDLSKAAKGWVMALSEGPVNQDLLSINYKKLKKLLFPFSKEEFEPNLKPYLIKH